MWFSLTILLSTVCVPGAIRRQGDLASHDVERTLAHVQGLPDVLPHIGQGMKVVLNHKRMGAALKGQVTPRQIDDMTNSLGRILQGKLAAIGKDVLSALSYASSLPPGERAGHEERAQTLDEILKAGPHPPLKGKFTKSASSWKEPENWEMRHKFETQTQRQGFQVIGWENSMMSLFHGSMSAYPNLNIAVETPASIMRFQNNGGKDMSTRWMLLGALKAYWSNYMLKVNMNPQGIELIHDLGRSRPPIGYWTGVVTTLFIYPAKMKLAPVGSVVFYCDTIWIGTQVMRHQAEVEKLRVDVNADDTSSLRVYRNPWKNGALATLPWFACRIWTRIVNQTGGSTTYYPQNWAWDVPFGWGADTYVLDDRYHFLFQILIGIAARMEKPDVSPVSIGLIGVINPFGKTKELLKDFVLALPEYFVKAMAELCDKRADRTKEVLVGLPTNKGTVKYRTKQVDVCSGDETTNERLGLAGFWVGCPQVCRGVFEERSGNPKADRSALHFLAPLVNKTAAKQVCKVCYELDEAMILKEKTVNWVPTK